VKLDQNSFMENNHGEKFSPWTTYSDIFCSLMMVFVLLFSYAMIQYSLSNIKKDAETELMLQTSAEQEQQIIDLRAAQMEMEAQIIILEDQLSAAEEKASAQPLVVSLQSELSNAQYELQIIMAEKRDLLDEIDSLNTQLADFILLSENQETQINDQSQQLIILNAENMDLQAQIDALLSQNADLEARILLLDADLARMSEESGDKDVSIDEQRAKIIALSDKNAELEAQLVILNNTNTDLNAQIAVAQEEISTLNTALEEARSEAERLQQMIIVLQGNSDSMSVQIAELAQENDALISQNNDLRARLAAISSGDSTQSDIGIEEEVAGIRLEIIEQLRIALDESGVGVWVDSESGAIMLNSEVLFAVNESALKPEGKAFLDRFFPAYFDVLAKGESAQYIAQITVEGHTDTTGSYLTNLDLSMRRAQSVLAYCASMLDQADQEILIHMFNASGCAYANPIYNEDGSVDMDKSRRVEMKFTLKDASMIDEIRRIVEK